MSNNNSKKHIIILGAPGCGKGTQAQLLKQHFGFLHLSTGDLFRQKYAERDKNTRQGKASIDKGGFFSTEIAYEMISDFLEEHKQAKGIVYDGFPRNMEQARYFIENIAPQPLVIHLYANENKLTERLLLRGSKEHRADDSSTTIIQKRMQLYEELTFPIVSFFEMRGLLYTIDANESIKEIAKNIAALVTQLDQ